MKLTALKKLIPNTIAWMESRRPLPGQIWERKPEWPGARSRRWLVVSAVAGGFVRMSYLEAVSGRLRVYGDEKMTLRCLRYGYFKTPATMDLDTGAVSDQTGVLMPPAKPKTLPWKE